MNESLERLRGLTEALPDFSEVVRSKGTEVVEMEMEQGVGFGWRLLWEEKVAAARWFSSAGSSFPRHAHPEREWIVCYQGEMELRYDDGEVIVLRTGDGQFHDCNVAHSARFMKDTWYLAITVPASEGWPQ